MFTHKPVEIPELSTKNVNRKRFYLTPEGKLYPSITTVLQRRKMEGLMEWRKKVGDVEANKITQRAASRGTDLHTLVEDYLYNRNLSGVQPLSNLLFKIIKPELDNIGNIFALEKRLYSKELGVAGTVDCIAEHNGELAIIDFKTSKKEKPRDWIDHYFVQCAAYACMLYELTGIIVKKFVILMSCEDGECIVYEERDKEKYIKLLLQYLREYNEK